jgi:hypothetical protein
MVAVAAFCLNPYLRHRIPDSPPELRTQAVAANTP